MDDILQIERIKKSLWHNTLLYDLDRFIECPDSFVNFISRKNTIICMKLCQKIPTPDAKFERFPKPGFSMKIMKFLCNLPKNALEHLRII